MARAIVCYRAPGVGVAVHKTLSRIGSCAKPDQSSLVTTDKEAASDTDSTHSLSREVLGSRGRIRIVQDNEVLSTSRCHKSPCCSSMLPSTCNRMLPTAHTHLFPSQNYRCRSSGAALDVSDLEPAPRVRPLGSSDPVEATAQSSTCESVNSR